jgi:hypothetical protein
MLNQLEEKNELFEKQLVELGYLSAINSASKLTIQPKTKQ